MYNTRYYGRDYRRNNKYTARSVDRTPLDVDAVRPPPGGAELSRRGASKSSSSRQLAAALRRAALFVDARRTCMQRSLSRASRAVAVSALRSLRAFLTHPAARAPPLPSPR